MQTIHVVTNGIVEQMELYTNPLKAAERANELNDFNETNEWQVLDFDTED